MNIDKTTLYPLEEIVKYVGLPVIVHKPRWSADYNVRVERMQDGKASGTAFKNNVVHGPSHNYPISDLFYYVDSERFNSISELLEQKQDELYNEVFLKSLGNINCSNTDAETYEQCEGYLKRFAESYGVNLENEDFQNVKTSLLNSESYKKHEQNLQANLEFFIKYPTYISWDGSYFPWDVNEKTVSNILDRIVSLSKQYSRPLTRRYARILASIYYVDHMRQKVTADILYKNLLHFLSDEEFNTWILDGTNCFEEIVKKFKARITTIRKYLLPKSDAFPLKLDDQILITQLVQTKKFKNAVQNYPFLLSSARNGPYKDIISQFLKDNRMGLDCLLFSAVEMNTAPESSPFALFWNSIEPELADSEPFEYIPGYDFASAQIHSDPEIEYLMY